MYTITRISTGQVIKTDSLSRVQTLKVFFGTADLLVESNLQQIAFKGDMS